MKSKTRRCRSLTLATWAIVFYCSGACLLGSLVIAICLPQFVNSIEWIYLLSLASGIVFSFAAIRRQRLTHEHFQATDDAAWLTNETHMDAADSLDLGDH